MANEAQQSSIPLDAVPVRYYFGDNITVEWNNDQKTTVSKDEYDRKVGCVSCPQEIHPPERFKLLDHCRKCYAALVVGVPYQIAVRTGVISNTYEWEFPVSQTRSQDARSGAGVIYSSDYYGNNFGVGDVVLYDRSLGRRRNRNTKPEPLEGVVLAIHQYKKLPDVGWICHYPDRTYGVRVDLGKDEPSFIVSKNLVALTNGNVKFAGMERFPEIVDVPIGSGIYEKSKAILDDPKSAAIWIGYRRSHILDQYAGPALNRSALTIARELRETKMDPSRIALWLKRKMQPPISEELATFLAPYLSGEKTASYVITP